LAREEAARRSDVLDLDPYDALMEQFDPGNRIVVEANPAYTGYRPARLARIEGIYLSPATFFIAFENGEVDMVTYDALTPADYAPALKPQPVRPR